MKKLTILFLSLFLFQSCNNKTEKEEKIPNIDATDTKSREELPIITDKKDDFDVQLGEDSNEINAYVKNIYQKNGKIYIDLDFVEIRYPTEGDWDVSDREIVNNNPKIRIYIIDENTLILSHICQKITATTLFEIRKVLLKHLEKDKYIITIGKSKNGKMLEINFGCYG